MKSRSSTAALALTTVITALGFAMPHAGMHDMHRSQTESATLDCADAACGHTIPSGDVDCAQKCITAATTSKEPYITTYAVTRVERVISSFSAGRIAFQILGSCKSAPPPGYSLALVTSDNLRP